MLNLKLFVLCVTLFILEAHASTFNSIKHAQERSTDNKLRVLVLYESLCPDSKRFMKHFTNVYDDLQNYLDVQLVPFGKAWSRDNGAQFYCQHGPAECAGNRLQDCVLNTTTDQKEQVDFAVCQMLTTDTANADICGGSTVAGFGNANIEECMRSSVGTELQLESERITHSYAPTFIPTIIYNGVFDQRLQHNSIRNFRATLCGVLKGLSIISDQSEETPCGRYPAINF